MKRALLFALIILGIFSSHQGVLAAEMVMALYVPGGALDVLEKRTAIKILLRDYDPNGVVINLKDDSGNLLVDIDYFLRHLQEKGKFKKPYDRYVSEFKDLGTVVVCRLVVFKDLVYPRSHPRFALKNSKTKNLWKNHQGEHWVDPSDKEYQRYLLTIARLGMEAGCNEINFDYVRFPNRGDGNTDQAEYPLFQGGHDANARREVINGFLQDAQRALGRNNLSAAVFGYAFSTGRGVNIGQDLADFARHLRYAAAMAYPSHWECTTFGFDDPNLHPYGVYKKAIADGLGYLKKHGMTMPVRPYIQAFDFTNTHFYIQNSECIKKKIKPTRVIYGRAKFRDQIRAIEEFPQYQGWMAWNPSGVYSSTLFNSKRRP